MIEIIWTDYMKYRANLRGFELQQLERIVRFSGERYYDTVTGNQIVVGKHNRDLVVIPDESSENYIIALQIKVRTFINPVCAA